MAADDRGGWDGIRGPGLATGAEDDGDHTVNDSTTPLNSGADPGLPVMTWGRFWQLVEVLGGEAGTETCQGFEEACARLTETLSREPVGQIIGFGERLAEALYRLDQADFGTQPVLGMAGPDGSPFPQSDDGFLCSRAAVVAAAARYTRASSAIRNGSHRSPHDTARSCSTSTRRHSSR
ncbi:DUF4240 domain-containing protein [Kitasatospora gansuensis]